MDPTRLGSERFGNGLDERYEIVLRRFKLLVVLLPDRILPV